MFSCTHSNDVTVSVDRYTYFDDIPSIWWKMATIACGIGAALSLLVASAGVSSLCIENVLTRTTCRAAAVLQLIAGLYVYVYVCLFVC